MNKIKLALLLALTPPLSAGAAVSTIHKDVNASGITLLAVNSVSGDIAITTGAPGAISADITYDAENCTLVMETRGKTAYFEAARIKRWHLFNFGSKAAPCAMFSVKAPAGLAVDAVSVSGDLLLENLNGPVTGKTVSGNAVVSGPGALTLTTVSGSLKVAGAAGSLRFHTTNGDIGGSIKASDDVEARTVSGDIDLYLLKPPVKGAFSLASVSGDIKLTLPKGAKADASLQSVSGEQKNSIVNDPAAAFKIAAKTTSGDIAIEGK